MEESSNIYFKKLEDEVELNLEKIWKEVLIPYLNLERNVSILNLDEYDIHLFKDFFYKNSKYYKFIEKNLYN